MNTFGYVGGNPLKSIDPLGLHHDGNGCVDGAGNKVACPKNVCVTAECAAGVMPNPPQTPCSDCRAACIGNFLNPVPGMTIEKGAGAAGKKFGDLAGDLVKDAAKKFNKAAGAYELTQCMNKCKKICNKEPSCE